LEIIKNRSFSQTVFVVSSLTQKSGTNMTQNINNDDFILTQNRKRQIITFSIQFKSKSKPAKKAFKTKKLFKRGSIAV
jgi:hypothetical protein